MSKHPNHFTPERGASYFFVSELLNFQDPESKLAVSVYEHLDEVTITEYVLWWFRSQAWQDLASKPTDQAPTLEEILTFLEEMEHLEMVKQNWRLLYGLVDLQLTVKEELEAGKE